MRILWALLAALFLLGGAVESAELPDEARLSADRMRFDARTGDFLANGNVVIQVDGLNVHAPRGTGNVKQKEVRFSEGIVASGDWQGEWVDLKAGTIALSFGQPAYTVEKGVVGSLGKLRIDADSVSLKGAHLTALNVRRLEDREAGMVFSAKEVQGTLKNGVLVDLTAKKDVRLQGRPNKGGDTVDLRGDMAVYSVERGSVVLSGNVRAVQKGRELTSQSVVYFPQNNRIEALGGVGEDGTKLPTTIIFDLKQEKSRKGGGK